MDDLGLEPLQSAARQQVARSVLELADVLARSVARSARSARTGSAVARSAKKAYVIFGRAGSGKTWSLRLLLSRIVEAELHQQRAPAEADGAAWSRVVPLYVSAPMLLALRAAKRVTSEAAAELPGADARALAAQLLGEYVRSAPEQSLADPLPQTPSALGSYAATDGDGNGETSPLRAMLLGAIKQRSLVLLLDDLDQVPLQDVRALVLGLLARGFGSRLVAASRPGGTVPKGHNLLAYRLQPVSWQRIETRTGDTLFHLRALTAVRSVCDRTYYDKCGVFSAEVRATSPCERL